MYEQYDVAIIGGGPAGSSCARQLTQSGAKVVVIDQKTFPRDKTCAGWVTPQVFDILQIDPVEYQNGRVLQPIEGFRTGVINGREIETRYGKVVSYGIRRSEFDLWLLNRCGAELRLGQAIRSMTREDDRWLINETWKARLLVGAGGHFCPVARRLGARDVPGAAVVTAQEIEFEASDSDLAAGSVKRNIPELFFCNDLSGYGWCFRKGSFLNIGLGRIGPEHLVSHVDEFLRFLYDRGKVVASLPGKFHGHAYQLYDRIQPRLFDEGVLLIGDAAGLANPQSGEGIRPAVESGLIAAEVIRDARDGSRSELQLYAELIQAHLKQTGPRVPWAHLPNTLFHWVAGRLLSSRWFTRKIVLDHCFLRNAI